MEATEVDNVGVRFLDRRQVVNGFGVNNAIDFNHDYKSPNSPKKHAETGRVRYLKLQLSFREM